MNSYEIWYISEIYHMQCYLDIEIHFIGFDVAAGASIAIICHLLMICGNVDKANKIWKSGNYKENKGNSRKSKWWEQDKYLYQF